MKISDRVNNRSNVDKTGSKEDKKVSENQGSNFSTQLKKAHSSDFNKRIQKLAKEVMEQGEKLSKSVDVGELKKYRTLISNFLEEIVSNSHKFDKDDFLDRRGRYRVFATTKKINKDLDELTEQVLSNEQDNIKILKKIEDIRGLILDLSL